MPKLHKKDNLKFQLIFGDGIGRYINDLNTLSGLDGVFDAEGKIRTLPVMAAYIAYQHWWTDALRSSFLYSGVQIDNYSFQPDNSYYKTERVTGNIVYSPVPRFNVGVELLWGRRTNQDRQDGEAVQMQLTRPPACKLHRRRKSQRRVTRFQSARKSLTNPTRYASVEFEHPSTYNPQGLGRHSCLTLPRR
ncbi:MAG TPA: hypothetical protein EYQ14_10095 [Gammaproteobacteria bacterium]|nr:hypothetical protein [Gammaproteobacteria bacterium]